MFKSLMSLTGSLTVGFFFCFAVALQAQPAGPAKQISQGAPVFSFDPLETLKRAQKSWPNLDLTVENQHRNPIRRRSLHPPTM